LSVLQNLMELNGISLSPGIKGNLCTF
jgi:hypothetical protein